MCCSFLVALTSRALSRTSPIAFTWTLVTRLWSCSYAIPLDLFAQGWGQCWRSYTARPVFRAKEVTLAEGLAHPKLKFHPIWLPCITPTSGLCCFYPDFKAWVKKKKKKDVETACSLLYRHWMPLHFTQGARNKLFSVCRLHLVLLANLQTSQTHEASPIALGAGG